MSGQLSPLLGLAKTKGRGIKYRQLKGEGQDYDR